MRHPSDLLGTDGWAEITVEARQTGSVMGRTSNVLLGADCLVGCSRWSAARTAVPVVWGVVVPLSCILLTLAPQEVALPLFDPGDSWLS